MALSFKFKWYGPYSFSNESANLLMENWSNSAVHGLYIFTINKKIHYIGKQTKDKYTIFNRVMEHYHGILSGRENIYKIDIDDESSWKKAIKCYPDNFSVIFNECEFIKEVLKNAFNYLSRINIFVSTVDLINNIDGSEYSSKQITSVAEKYMIYNYSPAKNDKLKRDENSLKNNDRIEKFKSFKINDKCCEVNNAIHSYNNMLLPMLLNCIDKSAKTECCINVSVNSK